MLVFVDAFSVIRGDYSKYDGTSTTLRRRVPNENFGLKRKRINNIVCSVNSNSIEEERGGEGQQPKEKKITTIAKQMKDHTPQVSSLDSGTMFNVVLTHCTADFDSLASAVGLAKLWSSPTTSATNTTDMSETSSSSSSIPTYVVLPRGAHPAVQRFLALHKHLFPIRSLKSLPDTSRGCLNRLGLVDAQRRDRVGPAEPLLQHARRVVIMDHHVDTESDIPEATDYIVDHVGSVSTMVVERLMMAAHAPLTEAEATLLALGIHADTGSLCYDSTTARDVRALAWIMEQGASQAVIAEHAKSSLSDEQQGVLTQALLNTNSTMVHGVTVSTVLLSAGGFIHGLAAVTQDALELTSSDVMLLAVVYDPKADSSSSSSSSKHATAKKKISSVSEGKLHSHMFQGTSLTTQAEAWRGGEEALKRKRLRAAFEKRDTDGSGYLERHEISAALASSGVIASVVSVKSCKLMFVLI